MEEREEQGGAGDEGPGAGGEEREAGGEERGAGGEGRGVGGEERGVGAVIARLRAAARGARTEDRLLAGGAGLLFLLLVLASLVRLPELLVSSVAIAVSFGMVALTLRRIRLDHITIGIILAGLGFYLVYLGYTDYGERNYDGPAQVEYIEHIVTQRSLPPASKCLICHHPPFYYLLGAGVFAVCKATAIAAPAKGLQVFSLLITLFFVVYGLLIVRRFLPDPRMTRLAAAILVFWPYSVHNSVRVHNDTLVSALIVAALYYAIRWRDEDRPRDLYLSAVITALGVLTKSSAYPMVALLLGLIGLRLLRPGRVQFLPRAGAAVLLLAAALFLNTLRKGKPEDAQAGAASAASLSATSGLCHKVLGSACDVNPAALLENTPYNYLYFDVQNFLREPYVLTDQDESGRQLFWNHLLKSSMFGSHNRVPDRETAYELNRHIAGVMCALLVGMLAYFAFAGASASRAALRRYAVPLLALAALLGFLAAFRILLPAPHHTDFRLAFPALVPATLIYVAAVDHFRRRELMLGTVGYALIVPFLALSILYWTPKYNLAIRLTRRVAPQAIEAFSQLVPEGSPWDREGNLIFEGNHVLQFTIRRRQVSEVDVTLDSNDRYEISLHGTGAPRTFTVGPSQSGPGLARYIETLDPPAAGVREITVRALRGDRAYSLGHLILR